jgi:hypothetical protein
MRAGTHSQEAGISAVAFRMGRPEAFVPVRQDLTYHLASRRSAQHKRVVLIWRVAPLSNSIQRSLPTFPIFIPNAVETVTGRVIVMSYQPEYTISIEFEQEGTSNVLKGKISDEQTHSRGRLEMAESPTLDILGA